MSIDVFEERGGSEIDLRWGNPQDCHFPLFPSLEPLSYPLMCWLYGVMWLGAVCIMLGFKFRIGVFMFGIPYWYIHLMDKTYWNNHSYLYGIVTILLMGSSANHSFSIDSVIDKSIRNQPVPYWNYFILKYQFFMLYFLAGLKKSGAEWLEGYSLIRLGEHWVFFPFRIIFSVEQIDYLVIHWFGFLLDLTVGFWMLLEFSRPIALFFCSMFHLMNSRLFSIGMFPYVCLATLPLFCKENWPRTFWSSIVDRFQSNVANESFKKKREKTERKKIYSHPIKLKENLVVACLFFHMGLQVFLPYSHFITKGYNTWTEGLYGYSWDMMVHSWNSVLVVVKVVDNESGQEHFLDPNAWSLKNRWNYYADMSLQYAQCIKKNLNEGIKENNEEIVIPDISKNISIYIDVWCSLNGRFQQRMYDPNYDLLRAKWSPFEPVEWLMPLMIEYNNFREQIPEIIEHVHSWNNESNVIFVADFPGMYLENFIEEDFHNVSLTVLRGEVVYEMEDYVAKQSLGMKLSAGESVYTHKIHTVSADPSCYMYTFSQRPIENDDGDDKDMKTYSPFPLIEDISARNAAFLRMIDLIWNATTHILFDYPLTKNGIVKPDI
ncbi:vitamin K-dependent gamma-carboxylase-like isoform X1 [Sitophilus oryzae]|uniref:Vitamin K-dependent gamma-carboxylase-like isoform X1 n=1 Tax=Sitophilus oryzae TaxID=7048 RepID=A0A6J2Y3A0_SITOR|nr:vitamin K-dependent gamma-carboxylase-like isoform X1 [Sitophilus oryzae]